jgi:hypothetical protein
MKLFIFFLLPLSGAMAQQVRFEAQEIDNNVEIGYGLAIGDVDGDGRPDILLADKKQFVWYRNGDWNRFVMAENLTEHDNVCIAARDINGDGKVEVAVGAQWNPAETSDTSQSGSVHYLIRPEDPTQLWEVVTLPHEPTVHRMRWARAGTGEYHLIVLPLHGRGNRMGQGAGVRVQAYLPPSDPGETWKIETIDASMHMTHNLDIVANQSGGSETILVGGRQGVKAFDFVEGNWKGRSERIVADHAVGELRMSENLLATVEPMHGNKVALYNGKERSELDASLAEGHAIGWVDILGKKGILSGWRVPNAAGDVGIKLYFPQDTFENLKAYWIDQNGMATEDMQVADLDGDGKPDIIASGRSTHNLKIYWNKSSLSTQ